MHRVRRKTQKNGTQRSKAKLASSAPNHRRISAKVIIFARRVRAPFAVSLCRHAPLLRPALYPLSVSLSTLSRLPTPPIGRELAKVPGSPEDRPRRSFYRRESFVIRTTDRTADCHWYRRSGNSVYSVGPSDHPQKSLRKDILAAGGGGECDPPGGAGAYRPFVGSLADRQFLGV